MQNARKTKFQDFSILFSGLALLFMTLKKMYMYGLDKTEVC